MQPTNSSNFIANPQYSGTQTLLPGPQPISGPGYTPNYTQNPATVPQPPSYSYGSYLPATPTSPTSTVTVATSDLANSNYNNQQAGFNQLETSVQNHALNKPPKTNSIVDFLDSQGKPSDYASRAKLASQYGIPNYSGTANQNLQLIQLLSNQGTQQQGTPGTQTANIPQGWDPVTYANFKRANPTLEPDAEDTRRMLGQTSYQEQVDDVTRQYQDLVDKHMRDLEAIRSGTFPLSAIEQEQLDSTKRLFDENRQLQIEANKNYQKALENAQFRAGTNLTDLPQFLAKNQQAISDGIRKVNLLDAQATQTINQLRQSFMDKDYKLINDQYNELRDLLKQKSEAIDKVHKDAVDQERDLRDYNLKAQEFELHKQKTYLEMAKIRKDMQTTGVATLGDGAFAKNVKTALSGIRFPSVADRKGAETIMAQLIADGDFAGAKEQLNQYAFNSMTTDEQQKLAGKDDAIQALDRIEKGLNILDSKGVSTGFLTGLKQKALEKGGFLADAELNTVAEDIALAIIDYRKAVSGAAFTESEGKQYEALFPSTGNTPALNKVKIDTLKKKFDNDIISAYSRRIPKYKDIADSLSEVSDDPLNLGIGTSNSNSDPLGIN